MTLQTPPTDRPLTAGDVPLLREGDLIKGPNGKTYRFEEWGDGGFLTFIDEPYDGFLATLCTFVSRPATSAAGEGADHEAIERSLRTIRSYDAVRFLRDALSATTQRLSKYDWNADPDSITKQQGDAFSAADQVFADLNAAVDAIPEMTDEEFEAETEECGACSGFGKIVEAACTSGNSQHSGCQMDCDECDGVGRVEALARPATSAAGEGEGVDGSGWLVTHKATAKSELQANPLADLPFNHKAWTWEPVYTLAQARSALGRAPKPPHPDCPHAAPFRFCPSCKVNPCPIGLGEKA